MHRHESSDQGQNNRDKQINVGQNNQNGINNLANQKDRQNGPLPNVENIWLIVVPVLIKLT